MKQFIILVFAILLGLAPATAQRHEVGLFLGASYYNGDLNASAPFVLAKPAAGVAYRYIMNPRWAFKFNGYYGQLEGDDQSNPDAGLRDRNLYFKSNLFEFAGLMEFNFMRFTPGSERERFTPFIFGGLSVFRFNPRAVFNNQWYDLQPLGTEGQGTTAYPDRHHYSLTSVGIPFGLGMKFSISQTTQVAFEWGMRKTFTDYIDDVSKTYADPFILWSENTPAAMLFGNRMLDDAIALMGLQVSPQPGGGVEEDMVTLAGLMAPFTGEQRGDESTKDWYSFVGITFTFQIKGPKAKKCDAYRDHYYYKEYKLGRRR
jgi:hypothetical protein